MLIFILVALRFSQKMKAISSPKRASITNVRRFITKQNH